MKKDVISEEQKVEERLSRKQKRIEKKKKSKVRKIVKITLLIILLLIVGVAGAFTYKVYKNGWGLSGLLSTIVGQDEKKLEQLDRFNVLLMGESLNLTDTIIIASYDPKLQDVSMLSIPRDTFTGINKKKATAFQKINALYQSSPEKTLEAVNKITGLDIKYYLCVDTKALREIVNEIGGVYFDVPIDMKYDDKKQNLHINVRAGYQLLDGDKAEQVVRFRHNNDGTTYSSEYGQEDLGRMRTQREFLKTVAKQTLKAQNVFKINSILDIYKNNVTTNLDMDLVKQYIPYAVNINMDEIETETLPGEPEKCNGVWLFIHNNEETELMVNKLFRGINSGENEEI
ncbi:MAG: LCP family protein [Clostridia bacterium]|nr:LCP family protein [Clostridia bacterium]